MHKASTFGLMHDAGNLKILMWHLASLCCTLLFAPRYLHSSLQALFGG